MNSLRWPQNARCAVVVTVDFNDEHGILTQEPRIAGREKSLSVWRYGAKRGVDRVLDALGETGADAIGVNNRDLKTFEVSAQTSLALVDRIPASVVRVTESGISTHEDIIRLRKAGFDAFLIGESLMRQPDPGVALADLLKGAMGKP